MKDLTTIRADLTALLQEHKLDCVFLDKGTLDEWHDVEMQIGDLPCNHGRYFAYYQQHTMLGYTDQYKPLNLIIMENGTPIGLWLLSLGMDQGVPAILSNEAWLMPPVFINGYGEKKKKKTRQICFEILQDFARQCDVPMVRTTVLTHDKAAQGWVRAFMEQGGTTHDVQYEVIIDLNKDYEDIRAQYRRRFKSYISKYQNVWDIAVVDHLDDAQIEQFLQKHQEVAGKSSRSVETWTVQKEASHHNEAFVVTASDKSDGRLLGFALFLQNRCEAQYAVGVYERNTENLPIGHIIQDKCIQEAKARGLKRYYIGTRLYENNVVPLYPGYTLPTTDKQLQISYFKEGFDTALKTRLIVNMEIKNHG